MEDDANLCKDYIKMRGLSIAYISRIWNLLCREPKRKEEISTVHVFSLPFRLAIGKIARFQYVYKGDLVDIWVYNEIPSYSEDVHDEILTKYRGNYVWLTSKVLIHYKNTQITDNDFNWIVSSVKSNENITSVYAPYLNADKSHEITNRFLSSCNAVSPYFFQGGDIKTMNRFLMFEDLKLAMDVVIAQEGFSLSKEQAGFILKCYPFRLKLSNWQYAAAIPSLKDIKEAQSVLDNSDQLLFYELLYDAKSKEMQGDIRGALIQASTALESLIWLVLEGGFRIRFIEVKDKLDEREEKNLLSDKKIGEVIRDFGRELGLTQLLESIPYLFLTDDDRPKPSEIAKAIKAISLRNKLIHSSKNPKSGEYFWREKHSFNKHYSALYGFIFKLGSSVRKKLMN
jgi:hypothetical protein